MFGNIDNKYPLLLECELVQYEGGGGRWELHIEAHKVVDSVGRFFSGIYKAGQGSGFASNYRWCTVWRWTSYRKNFASIN